MYAFSEKVFFFEVGFLVMSVSDEVKKDIDIYFEETCTFFQERENVTAFFFWLDFSMPVGEIDIQYDDGL